MPRRQSNASNPGGVSRLAKGITGQAPRIGLTMRTMDPTSYPEPRDCLAQDWIRFMARALPGVPWMPIPNLGAQAVQHAEQWQLNALIFTGGESPGENPLRDATETALLEWALRHTVGVFGVCRGLQMIQTFFGGSLLRCEGHAGGQHPVAISDTRREVNSYHGLGVKTGTLAPPLQVLGTTDDGWIEALRHPSAPILAVQWHPERLPVPHPADIALLRSALFVMEG